MIDLHMHILPGVDDGAHSWEEALAMAQMAVESGTKGIVATSHGNIGDLSIEKYAEAFFQFRKKLKEENIHLGVYPGMEVFMTPEAVRDLEREELLTINNTRYVLVEFDFGEEVWMVNHCLELLEEAGYTPVIAHPERYAFAQREPQMVFDWVMKGFVTQVNKGSFVGTFGRRVQNTAMALLSHNLVHVIASDAHSMHHRTPQMRGAVRFLEGYIPEEYTDLIFEKNPKHILKNEEIEAYRPRPFGRPRHW